MSVFLDLVLSYIRGVLNWSWKNLKMGSKEFEFLIKNLAHWLPPDLESSMEKSDSKAETFEY